MTAPAADAYEHFRAIKALLVAPMNQHVYELGQVPGRKNAAGTLNQGTAPNVYMLLVVERRYVEPTRVGRASRSGWRITTIIVGRNPGEVRSAQFRSSQALEGARLQVGDRSSRPVIPETPGSPQPDDAAISAQDTYVYVC